MFWALAAVVAILGAVEAVPPFFAGVLVCALVQRARREIAADGLKEPCDAPAMISVVGNVGCGKSTALKQYETDGMDDVLCVLEPLHEWAPMLREMETNERAWMDLQIAAATFYATLTAPANKDVVMTERDLMSVALFGGNRKGVATLLLALVDIGAVMLPDVVVHVATPWEECLARVESKRRGQAGDAFAANKGAEYFQALDVRHDRLMHWYAAQGCLVITLRSLDTAVLGLNEAREHALAARTEGPRRKVTKAMMASLLALLWPAPLDPL